MKNRLEPPNWPQAPFRRSERLARLVQHLEDNLGDPLTAAAAAALSNLEPSAFSKFFKRRVGITFREWVRLFRTVKALELLRETELPVPVIASRTGLGSARSLERVFRRTVGVTPREFRSASQTETDG